MHAIPQTKTAETTAKRIKQAMLAQILQNFCQVGGGHIQASSDVAVQHRLANRLRCDVNQSLNGILAGAG
jgi:hypothetical protein